MVILQDECSFVSLRDIERAMIVFEWFHLVLDHIEKDDLYKDTVCIVNCLTMTFMKCSILYRNVIVTQEH